MAQLDRTKRFAIATAIIVAVIIYGSLYPFTFRPPVDGLDPAVRALVHSWAARWGRITFGANILLYMPLGFFTILARQRGAGTARKVVLITLAGAVLSVSIELAQYFDDDRVADAPDVYANTIGTLLGALCGRLLGQNLRSPRHSEITADNVSILLLAAWVGYRLFPYVPTLDVHKYWNGLKPVILHPSLTGYDLFHYTALWLAVSALIEAIVGPKRVWLLFPLFAGCVLVGKIIVVNSTLSVAEIVGAAMAITARGILAFNRRLRTTLITLGFCTYVVAERLEPFQFGATPGPFEWVPFFGFMSGDLEIDAMAFLQKVFLYGGAIWLLVKAGLRLRPSTLLIALLLFLTSQAERFLPHRSAEITDAVMALVIGAIFALIRTRPNDAGHALGAE